jgi:hypothetical protein
LRGDWGFRDPPAVRTPRALFVVPAVLLWSALAAASSPDLDRQIQALKGTAADVEALDSDRRVREEIGVLKSWLDEASNYNARGAENTSRKFLDLCVGQTELIRQRLQTVKLQAEAADKRKTIADTKKQIQQTREAIEKAKQKKAVLEAQTR